MSDVATAAAAMGVPEALVERSVEARAAASGVSVDDLLGQWAGGEAAPAPAPPAPEPETPEAETETEAPEPAAPPTPEVVTDVPSEPAPPAPPPTPAGRYKPPVLVGVKDNPMIVLAGVIGLFLVVVMVGLVGPSIPGDIVGARSSEVSYSDAALNGQNIYETTGCAACHTQMVRPVVADVGLGPVTLGDTDQVLGSRRFGPDLSDVGNRISSSQIEAIIGGLGDHPAHSLGQDDLDDLIAYLSESKTSTQQVEGS